MPYTLRELVWMVEARSAAQWNHTAALLALVANCHRDPKKRPRPFTPRTFHPHHQARRLQHEPPPVRQMSFDRFAAYWGLDPAEFQETTDDEQP